MASRIPALPQDSHVQSHAAVHKNKLCDSHAPLVAGAIAGGWTRPVAVYGERPLSGNPIEATRTAPTITLILRTAIRASPLRRLTMPIEHDSDMARASTSPTWPLT